MHKCSKVLNVFVSAMSVGCIYSINFLDGNTMDILAFPCIYCNSFYISNSIMGNLNILRFPLSTFCFSHLI